MELVLISIGVTLLAISFLGVALLSGFAFGLYYASYYYDKSEKDGSRKWRSFQRAITVKLFHYIKKIYFDYEVIYRSEAGDKESNEKVRDGVTNFMIGTKGKSAIFAASPHGLFAISTFFLVGTPDYYTEWGLACEKVRPCIHRHVFAVPFLRDIALWFGAIDVSKENIEKMLETSSILLAPGGTREMIIDTKNPIQTYHKGFLKIAFEKKKLVFPIIHTGQERVFRSYSFCWLDRVRTFVLKHTGYPFPTLFLGPFPSKLTTYIFEPHDPTKYLDEESFIDDYYKTVIKHNKEVNKK